MFCYYVHSRVVVCISDFTKACGTDHRCYLDHDTTVYVTEQVVKNFDERPHRRLLFIPAVNGFVRP